MDGTSGTLLAVALERLPARIEASRPSGFDHYPLPCPSERFPVANPAFSPREKPRPADAAAFLHGLLEGVARCRRLARDHEATPSSAIAFFVLAAAAVLLRRLAKAK